MIPGKNLQVEDNINHASLREQQENGGLDASATPGALAVFG